MKKRMPIILALLLGILVLDVLCSEAQASTVTVNSSCSLFVIVSLFSDAYQVHKIGEQVSYGGSMVMTTTDCAKSVQATVPARYGIRVQEFYPRACGSAQLTIREASGDCSVSLSEP